MNSAASDPVLVGGLWGTAALRAFRIDDNRRAIDGVSSPEGDLRVAGNSVMAVLDRPIGRRVSQAEPSIRAPVMIAGRNGWNETPFERMRIAAGLGPA